MHVLCVLFHQKQSIKRIYSPGARNSARYSRPRQGEPDRSAPLRCHDAATHAAQRRCQQHRGRLFQGAARGAGADRGPGRHQHLFSIHA